MGLGGFIRRKMGGETEEDQRRKTENRKDTQEIYNEAKHKAFRDEALMRASAAGKQAGLDEAKRRFPTPEEKKDMAKQKPSGGWSKLLAGIDSVGGSAMAAFERDGEVYFGSRRSKRSSKQEEKKSA